ncbi:hypothetical protein [Sediminicurvatus halobius]|uniref:Uncharacterized protein n=1 Tax=Sediminicurvatus halobius TaxID=2182432 RepID=A0A2U2MXN0_9GAMM|nr:hypothetical protein [Spiribacter halobius]PWG61686.1 hypothetical protein DEM34_15105 [Spiribacter halobius]UEX77311.1 hypothetical protein LMH63_15385 [Spiribacter halobius]
MKIRIAEDNAKLIEQALADEQGRARVRTLSRADIEQAADRAEATLERMGIAPSARKGCERELFAAVSSSAYRARGTPMATRALLRRGVKDWYLVELIRTPALFQDRRQLRVTREAAQSAWSSLVDANGVRNEHRMLRRESAARY